MTSPLRARDCDKTMNLGDGGALKGPHLQSLDPMHTAARTRANLLRRQPRFPITVRPTKADIAIAREIARDTGPAPEEVARALTWGADEKVLLVLAAAGWLASRGRGEPLGAPATMPCWSRLRHRCCRTR